MLTMMHHALHVLDAPVHRPRSASAARRVL